MCAETTELVLAARNRADENQRLRRLFRDAPAVIAHLVGPHHGDGLATETYLTLLGKSDHVYPGGQPFAASAMPARLNRGATGQQDMVHRPVGASSGLLSPVLVYVSSFY